MKYDLKELRNASLKNDESLLFNDRPFAYSSVNNSLVDHAAHDRDYYYDAGFWIVNIRNLWPICFFLLFLFLLRIVIAPGYILYLNAGRVCCFDHSHVFICKCFPATCHNWSIVPFPILHPT